MSMQERPGRRPVMSELERHPQTKDIPPAWENRHDLKRDSREKGFPRGSVLGQETLRWTAWNGGLLNSHF